MISYKKIFHGIEWLLLFGFLVLYFAQMGGYYENLNRKKTYLTEESIKRFEDDIANGKEIKVENYVINMKKNYANRISRFGLYTSKLMGKTFKWGITKTFEVVDKMMDDE